MSTIRRARRILKRRVEITKRSLGIGSYSVSREWYLARWGMRLAVAIALIGAWIHGIYWAGGLPGAHAWLWGSGIPHSSPKVPLELGLIDFAPLILMIVTPMLLVVVCMITSVIKALRDKWKTLPSYAERKRVEERHYVAEIQNRIAAMEQEYEDLGKRIAILQTGDLSDVSFLGNVDRPSAHRARKA